MSACWTAAIHEIRPRYAYHDGIFSRLPSLLSATTRTIAPVIQSGKKRSRTHDRSLHCHLLAVVAARHGTSIATLTTAHDKHTAGQADQRGQQHEITSTARTHVQVHAAGRMLRSETHHSRAGRVCMKLKVTPSSLLIDDFPCVAAKTFAYSFL